MDEQEEPAESKNFVSLFERSTLSGWDASLPATEVAIDSNFSGLRPSQLFRLFGAKVLPESFLFFVEQSLRWKVSFSTVHNTLAIQKDGVLEIWRDYYSVPVAKCRILDDEHPQWCKLHWSASGNLLLSARSVGAVDAFDGTGAFCFTIPLPSSDTAFNPLYSVASILSDPHTTDTVWSDRIWILQYDGNMRCYLAGRVSGYHPLSAVNVSGGPSSIAFSASLLPRANAVLVASSDPDVAISGDEKSLANRGISIWRVTDAEPYLEIFGKQDDATEAKANQQKKSFSLFHSPKEYVLQIVVNSDETAAACLSSRGDVVAFRIPSLQVIKTWSLGDEISPRRDNASFITGIGWWSQKELMLLYSTGFVATVNFDNDGTTAAVEKNYSPWTQLICASQGHVLLLEITGRPEKPKAKYRTWSSVIWPLVSAPYSLLKLAGQAFVGAPLTGTDVADSPVEMLPCRYILHEMKAITPPELFKKKLAANNYEEALTVAQTYCLNADRVYQEQWRKNAMTVESIDNFLVKVRKRSWIIEECLVQLPDSLDACKKLLDVGLKLTDDLSKLVNENDIKAKERECSARYRLVQYRRTLDDYETMLASGTSTNFDSRYYGYVRNLSLYEWALQLARTTEFARLSVLFSRYGHRLFQIGLPLLTNIPETISLDEYESMLPKLNQRPEWAIRVQDLKDDFIEAERFSKSVEIKKDDADILVKEKPALKNFILSLDAKPADEAAIVKKWYEFRAIEIERYTCMADLAEKFLRVAVTNGVTDLNDLCEDMALLRLLNYECSVSAPVSYERLKKFEPLEILRLLLKESPKEVFLRRFEQWAVPFCLRCEQRHGILAKTLIWKYLVASSEESLRTAIVLCQSFKTRRDWWSELIGLTGADIVRIVADCLSTCGDSGQIDTGFQLISYIPQPENPESKTLVQSLEDHLTALHLLNVYGISLSYQKLQSIAASDQESAMLLTRLVRHGTSSASILGGQKSITAGIQKSPNVSAGIQKPTTPISAVIQKLASTAVGQKSSPQKSDRDQSTNRSWTADDWRTLLKDMLQIARTVLPSIGEQRCHELFINGLLSSKSMDLIDLASKFLITNRDASISKKIDIDPKQLRLSYDSAVELIAHSADSYINEAADARDESLNYARKCLQLLENPPDRLVREREFIDALPILEYFDIGDVPARLKLYKNRLRLIEEIFSRRSRAYEEYEKLLILCKLLRVPVADRNEEKNLLIMCTRQALCGKDAINCAKFCREIVASTCGAGWRVCWEACVELCTTTSFNDEIRYNLLIFCLSHCDAEHIEPILNGLRGLKMELLKKEFDKKVRQLEHVPWTTAVWNEIRAKVKLEPVSEWRKDAIYLEATNYTTENQTESVDEPIAALFNFLRYLLLIGRVDQPLLDEVLALIGSSAMSSQTYLALMSLLAVKNEDVCELSLRSMPASPLSNELTMYARSLRAAVGAGVDGVDLKNLLLVDPRSLVENIYPFCNGQNRSKLKMD